jgi:hypothetical protein
MIYYKIGSPNKRQGNNKVGKSNRTRDTWFYPKVHIHKEFYVLIEELTKSQVSLNPFLSQVITKIEPWVAHYHKGAIQTFLASPHKAVCQGQPLTI